MGGKSMGGGREEKVNFEMRTDRSSINLRYLKLAEPPCKRFETGKIRGC